MRPSLNRTVASRREVVRRPGRRPTRACWLPAEQRVYPRRTWARKRQRPCGRPRTGRRPTDPRVRLVVAHRGAGQQPEMMACCGASPARLHGRQPLAREPGRARHDPRPAASKAQESRCETSGALGRGRPASPGGYRARYCGQWRLQSRRIAITLLKLPASFRWAAVQAAVRVPEPILGGDVRAAPAPVPDQTSLLPPRIRVDDGGARARGAHMGHRLDTPVRGWEPSCSSPPRTP